MLILIIYITLFILAYFIYTILARQLKSKQKNSSRKTITFGDESTVTPNRVASVISIAVLFIIWAAFTGSKLLPLHVPGPFIGSTSFSYTAINAQNQTDKATVYIRVEPVGNKTKKPEVPEQQTGFAKDDAIKVGAWRSGLVRVQNNDDGGKEKNYRIIAINDQPITAKQSIAVTNGIVNMTPKGSLSFTPDKGWQMEPVWLPAPETVIERFIEIAANGYQNITLWENIGWSLLRVLAGFILGCIVGIPLGYAMGLNNWFRGWFDPIVEFMRPIPPLALIPLVIIWFG
ncbi:MAG: ABC transporter permease, partial [Gammaproteobacteria bacterium]|nr:ABC transporter permease [Gammaproteobacteria bacterium]